MSPRILAVAFVTPLAFLLLFLAAAQPIAATPTVQDTPSDYQIVVTKTVGLDPSTCSDTSILTVPFATDVYYCYTVTNTGSLTLTRHTLRDSHLGSRVFVAELPPGVTLNTVAHGLILSSTIFITTTNIISWTAEPFGYEETLAAATATVNVPVIPSGQIHVTTFVDELNENSRCSLREAVRAANLDQRVGACPAGNGADTIILSAGTYPLRLRVDPPYRPEFDDLGLTGDLDIMSDLTIIGAGREATMIDLHGVPDRVFHILNAPGSTAMGSEGPIVTFIDFTMQKGYGSSSFEGASGIFATVGHLNLIRVLLKENRGQDPAIYSAGILTMTDSVMIGNVEGIYNRGTATIINTTFSDGGTALSNFSVDGQMTVINSTIRNNCSTVSAFRNGEIATLIDVIVENNHCGEIVVGNSGYLTMTRALIQGNSGELSGGIWNFGWLLLTDSQILSNSVEFDPDEEPFTLNGGGITTRGQFVGGTIPISLTVIDSVINNNLSAGTGAIYNDIDSDITLIRTEINNNRGGRHGGVFNRGTLQISNSQVNSNTVEAAIAEAPSYPGGRGGGITNRQEGTITMTTTSVQHNQLVNGGWGGGIWNAGILSVRQSTISNNQVAAETSNPNVTNPAGGGIFNQSNATVTNSTISHNLMAGTNSSGGGIENRGQLRLNNATVYSNTTEGFGAGIANFSPTTSSNSIIAGNTHFSGTPSDCSGSLTSEGHNLIGNSTGCTLTGNFTGNLLNVTPQLGPLANNGGETPTHTLLWDSPAIDAGATLESGGSACEATDQRGLARPQDGNDDGAARCDIGAYELCTDTSDPLCVAIDPSAPIDGTGGNVESPDAPHELHLPYLNLEQ